MDYSTIPEHCQEGVRAYFEEGRPIGGFLTAIFENDLVGAIRQADDVNIGRLVDYVSFLYNQMPARPVAWGTKRSVELWISVGGQAGYAKGGA